MNLQEIKAEILQDDEVRLEYEDLKPEYDVVKAILAARKQNKKLLLV
ncbi:MAG: hypothetical protein ACK5LY_07590 [Lachnospirales bacterium]